MEIEHKTLLRIAKELDDKTTELSAVMRQITDIVETDFNQVSAMQLKGGGTIPADDLLLEVMNAGAECVFERLCRRVRHIVSQLPKEESVPMPRASVLAAVKGETANAQ